MLHSCVLLSKCNISRALKQGSLVTNRVRARRELAHVVRIAFDLSGNVRHAAQRERAIGNPLNLITKRRTQLEPQHRFYVLATRRSLFNNVIHTS